MGVVVVVVVVVVMMVVVVVVVVVASFVIYVIILSVVVPHHLLFLSVIFVWNNLASKISIPPSSPQTVLAQPKNEVLLTEESNFQWISWIFSQVVLVVTGI